MSNILLITLLLLISLTLGGKMLYKGLEKIFFGILSQIRSLICCIE